MDWDLSLLLWVQSQFGPASLPFWLAVSDLGAAPCVAMTIGGGLWLYGSRFGIRLMIAAVLTIVLVDIVKVATFAPRPYYIWEQVQVYRAQGGLGMPSGHAAVATCVWGSLAASLRSRGVTLLAVIVVFLIGVSRIYLGLHSPSQVLLGWGMGAVILVALCRWETTVCHGFESWSLRGQWSLAFVTVVGFMLAKGAAMMPVAEKTVVPIAWGERYVEVQRDLADSEALATVSSLPLFRKVNVDHFGAFLGVWGAVILVAGGRGSHRFGVGHGVWNLFWGGLFVAMIVMLVRRSGGSVMLMGAMGLVVPSVLALGIPAVGGWSARFAGRLLGTHKA